MGLARERAANILLTCPGDIGNGGVQLLFRQLVQSLEQDGRRVHLVYQAALPQMRITPGTNAWGRSAFYCPMPTIVRNSVLLSMPIVLVYLPIVLLQLLRLMRSKLIDAVNCHYLHPYFIYLVIAARLLRRPVIISVHGADVDNYGSARLAERFIVRLILRGANQIVACSEALARQTAEVFPQARQKVTYVHNGLVLAGLPAADSVPSPAMRFVLSVCRQVHKKGVDTLLRAFALVLRDVPDVVLVVIGDGPLLEHNKALARTLGIEGRVRLMGDMPRAAVLPFFATCSVFALPSRTEPFGLVLLEAAYYRKAIVATRVGGIPEIITDNVDGRLVDPDDPNGMAILITGLLREPETAALLGRQAHATLMSRFLWKDRVDDYTALYAGERRRMPVTPAPQLSTGVK